MPIRYADVHMKAGAIRLLTSLTVDEFDALAPLVQQAFVAHMQAWTLEGRPRNGRRYSQYATCPLPTPEDRLLFVLMYLKGAPLQSAHGAAFGLTQPKANLWLHVLLTALREALAASGHVPARTVSALRERLETLTRPPAAAVTLAAPDTDTLAAADASVVADAAATPAGVPPLFHDGTERAIPRPTHPGDQADYYRGKKKRHMIKNLVLATAVSGGQVLFLSDTYEGSVHDKAIADDVPYPLPPGSELLDDLGFVGYALPGVIHTRPPASRKAGS